MDIIGEIEVLQLKNAIAKPNIRWMGLITGYVEENIYDHEDREREIIETEE